MKRIICFAMLMLAVVCNGLTYAEEDTTTAWDAQARGFLEVTRDNIVAAREWFIRAAEAAVEAGDWQGTLEAGSSLSTIGAHKEAADNFEQAEKLAQRNKNWQPSLAVAYAYAGLPKAMGKLKKAVKMMVTARKKAEKQKDWQGMIETGRGFLALNEKDQAIVSFKKAEKIANKVKEPKAYAALSLSFKEAGLQKEAQKYEQLAIENTPEEELDRIAAQTASAKSSGKIRKKGPPPPPGWSAYGESVAQPRDIDPSAQAMLQKRASDQLDEAARQAVLEQYEDSFRRSSKYHMYFFYYSQDYTYRIWDRHIVFNLQNWGRQNLQRFHGVNGVYIHP